MCQNKLIN